MKERVRSEKSENKCVLHINRSRLPNSTMKIVSAVIVALVATAARPCSGFAPPSFGRLSRTTALKMASNPDSSVFLTAETAKECIEVAGGTPLYAYSLKKLDEFSNACLAFPNAYGLTVRYAMKACPNAAILKFFNSKGIHIDASSGYEVRRAINAGIPPDHISLSTQELPDDFAELVDMGVKVNAW